MSISSLQDKVAIITGCSSGIGLATTRLFLERGSHVFGIDIGAQPSKLSEDFSTFTFYQADLTSTQAAEHAVAKCVGKHNRIDVLVNCAGVSDGWSSADTIHEEEWERVMSINLTVPIRMMKAVLPAMKSQKEGGSIVNVASKAGMSGASAGIAYTASKHGLVCTMSSIAACGDVEGVGSELGLSLTKTRLAQRRTWRGVSIRKVSDVTVCYLVVLRRISRARCRWNTSTQLGSIRSCKSTASCTFAK
jgi:NAD(P)-dependent dehydrogenase (short-subunit alcohol dehydrogenase family)